MCAENDCLFFSSSPHPPSKSTGMYLFISMVGIAPCFSSAQIRENSRCLEISISLDMAPISV